MGVRGSFRGVKAAGA